MNSHKLPESFFEPTTIQRTHFFLQKFNFVIKDGRIQLSNIQANESLVQQSHLCSAQVSKFVHVFQTNKCATITECDFVFDNKTVRTSQKILKIKSTLLLIS